MLVYSLASKYARFVVLGRLMYWTPPPIRPLDPPLLKSDDLLLGNQEILDPPLSKILDTPLNHVHNSNHCLKVFGDEIKLKILELCCLGQLIRG